MGLQAGEQGGELGRRRFTAIDAVTLGPALQMRRCEGAGTQSRRLQDRLQVKRRRALALGSGDVHGRQTEVGIADACEQGPDGELGARLIGARIVAHQAEQKRDGLIECADRRSVNHPVPAPPPRAGGRRP